MASSTVWLFSAPRFHWCAWFGVIQSTMVSGAANRQTGVTRSLTPFSPHVLECPRSDYFLTSRVQSVWVLASFSDNVASPWCKDAGENDATLIHPADVPQWDCLDSSEDEFSLEDYVSIECGCGETPAPVTPSTATPLTPLTSAPVTGGTISNTTAAPAPAPFAEPGSSSSSSSSFPLWAVGGGSIVGAVLLLIAGVFVAKRRRADKREGKPGAPASGTGKVPVADDNPVVRNYPVVPDGGGRNYPVVCDVGARNYPVVSSGDAGENVPTAPGSEGRKSPVVSGNNVV